MDIGIFNAQCVFYLLAVYLLYYLSVAIISYVIYVSLEMSKNVYRTEDWFIVE